MSGLETASRNWETGVVSLLNTSCSPPFPNQRTLQGPSCKKRRSQNRRGVRRSLPSATRCGSVSNMAGTAKKLEVTGKSEGPNLKLENPVIWNVEMWKCPLLSLIEGSGQVAPRGQLLSHIMKRSPACHTFTWKRAMLHLQKASKSLKKQKFWTSRHTLQDSWE